LINFRYKYGDTVDLYSAQIYGYLRWRLIRI